MMDENASQRADHFAELMKLHSKIEKLRFDLIQKDADLEECQAQCDQQCKQLLGEIQRLKCEKCEETRSTSDAQISAMRKELEEVPESLQDLESLNNVLTVQELNARKELQEARKESVNSLKDLLNSRSVLKIKRMGEIDQKAFQKACSKKFADEDWPLLASKLCSEWQQEVGNSEWHPFKKITLSGILKEVVDDDDEKLKQLRSELDEAAYEAVINALVEMNDYNPSGRYVVSEMWHSKEQKRATLKEIVEYLIKQVRSQKRKRKYS